MREIIFFTSNTTKLAHARHFAEALRIRIKGFRQQTYLANYDEPRSKSRDEVLRKSYESALAQWQKAGFSPDHHTFMLEDTSVRIDALSSATEDVPGLDIKFWMANQSFANLDALLLKNGNDRKARVRSDILLHVPRKLRKIWRTDDDFIVFVGEQDGEIVEFEQQFEKNLLYPWLDNKSFNRWFTTTKDNVPFGALSIEEAQAHDFRHKSFLRAYNFLDSVGYFGNQSVQLKLPLDMIKVVILCGHTCAGKTTASQHLMKDFGFLHVEASDFMYHEYYLRHGFNASVSIGNFAEVALLHKPEIAADRISAYFSEVSPKRAVVSGFRSHKEIEFLRRKLNLKQDRFQVFFIEADQERRFERLIARQRNGDELSFAQFQSRDAQQTKMGLETIRTSAGVVTISNNNSIGEFYGELEKHSCEPGWRTHRSDDLIDKLKNITDLKLEEAVMLALVTKWNSHEDRDYFTTTEISRLIRQTFNLSTPKHKDNVSRYFNQEFSVYFEMRKSPRGSARQYRLSNTGYGVALMLADEKLVLGY